MAKPMQSEKVIKVTTITKKVGKRSVNGILRVIFFHLGELLTKFPDFTSVYDDDNTRAVN